jgi:hypothetical protein
MPDCRSAMQASDARDCNRVLGLFRSGRQGRFTWATCSSGFTLRFECRRHVLPRASLRLEENNQQTHYAQQYAHQATLIFFEQPQFNFPDARQRKPCEKNHTGNRSD